MEPVGADEPEDPAVGVVPEAPEAPEDPEDPEAEAVEPPAPEPAAEPEPEEVGAVVAAGRVGTLRSSEVTPVRSACSSSVSKAVTFAPSCEPSPRSTVMVPAAARGGSTVREISGPEPAVTDCTAPRRPAGSA